MTTDLVLTDATLVLPDRVIPTGWIALADGLIAEYGEGSAPERGLDCAGDLLLPGLVELHTDNLETHYTPRPHVHWDPLSAVLAYDAQIAASGITTVFDSLRAGSDADRPEIGAELMALADAIAAARRSNLLRIEHFTHLRCEVAAPTMIADATAFLDRYEAQLASLMDHTPGQRQFTSLDTWKRFYQRKSSHSAAELDLFIANKLATHAEHAQTNRRWMVEQAETRGIVLASHDDANAAHVKESVRDGVAIAEFPTTLEAATASRDAQIQILMGAPNVIRGGSHSGNVSATELAEARLLDILSSDYVPASLLMAAFDLPRRIPAITLPEAVRTVTLNPARAASLPDRGAIAPGLRADLVRVATVDGLPMARETYRGGVRVA